VRAPAVLALGERGAIRHAEAVRVVLDEKDEPIEVRVSAALALGLMCDPNAVDLLTEHALKLRDPMANADARALGPVALGALARIKPAHHKTRRDPLLDKKTPLLLRRAAEAAIREPSACARRGSRAKR
jgi:HEAT repeat protein